MKFVYLKKIKFADISIKGFKLLLLELPSQSNFPVIFEIKFFPSFQDTDCKMLDLARPEEWLSVTICDCLWLSVTVCVSHQWGVTWGLCELRGPGSDWGQVTASHSSVSSVSYLSPFSPPSSLLSKLRCVVVPKLKLCLRLLIFKATSLTVRRLTGSGVRIDEKDRQSFNSLETD